MEYYQHSGRFSVPGLLLFAAILFIASVLFGAAYCAAVVFVPFVKLRAIIAIFFAILFGIFVGKLAESCKIRNRPLMWLGALGSSTISYYVAWGLHPLFVYITEDGVGQAFKDVGFYGFLPMAMFDWASLLFKQGLWSVGKNGGALSGWPLVVVWVVEAGILYIGTLMLANQNYGNRPFCEDCDQWTNLELSLAVLPVRGDDPAWGQVRSGDLDAIRRLTIAPDPAHYVRLDLATCSTCEGSDYLSGVTLQVIETSKETTTKESPIFTFLHLPRQKTNEIRDFAAQMQEAVSLLNESAAEEHAP